MRVALSNQPLEPRAISATKPTDPNGLVLSAWAQGFMAGAIIMLGAVTISNMRKGVLLHKLILLELFLCFWHGTYIFFNPPAYNWYNSFTAVTLNVSWSLHNLISWMKNKPFLGKKASYFYIGSLALVQPYWVFEMYANFAYFTLDQNDIFVSSRPWEPLFRDPWWVFTICSLIYNIKTRYEFSVFQLCKISPRFAILLFSMFCSLVFTIFDILVVTNVLKKLMPAGIDPFWQLSTSFKLLTDTIVLDDFKSALDRLREFKMNSITGRGSLTDGGGVPELQPQEGTLPRINPLGTANALDSSPLPLHNTPLTTTPASPRASAMELKPYYASPVESSSEWKKYESPRLHQRERRDTLGSIDDMP